MALAFAPEWIAKFVLGPHFGRCRRSVDDLDTPFHFGQRVLDDRAPRSRAGVRPDDGRTCLMGITLAARHPERMLSTPCPWRRPRHREGSPRAVGARGANLSKHNTAPSSGRMPAAGALAMRTTSVSEKKRSRCPRLPFHRQSRPEAHNDEAGHQWSISDPGPNTFEDRMGNHAW